MKRIFALILAASLLILCGCTQEAPYPETVPAPSTDATQETTEPTTKPTTEPTEPPVLYTNPLTGEPMDSLYTGRPTAVVINNIKACLPQYGIGAADMIYEFEVESSVTRLLAIYTDFTDVASIGPVRSTRTYFNNVAEAYDSPLIHCGGSAKSL